MPRMRIVSIGWIALALAGCSGAYERQEPAADSSLASGPSPAHEAPAPAGTGMVKGTVAYRERMALPPDAEAYVWIVDTTPGIVTTQVVLAETTVRAEGRQVPLPFELAYDPGRIVADHDYGLRAVLRSGGRTIFETREPTGVITKGAPSEVVLMLTRAEE